MSNVPIAEHALLSDCHSAALVTRDGSVDWLCFPRFDSPSVFARILDDDAGHWSFRPVGSAASQRRYADRSMVLETVFHGPGGTLHVTDALALGPRGEAHRLGRDAPHLLVRALRAEGGDVEVEMDYAPRPEYGLVRPLLGAVDGGVTARGGAEWLVLTCPVPVELDRSTARAHFVVPAGATLYFAMHRSTLGEVPAHVWSQAELAEALERTLASWRDWSDLHQTYDGPWRELVHHSGRVLQALTYFPSGAIVAAPTCSLPEGVGGERNWDYRFSWVRDASFTMEALWVAACPGEADDFFAFMTTAAAASVGPQHALQIMFGVGGEHDLSERELPHLSGWRDSRPVRVGNGAWQQQQIDVYGELLGAAHRLKDQIGDLDDDVRRFLVALADTAAVRWRETDQGIWEVRGEPRHFLYSKVMCWVALDRAVALADRLGAHDRVGEWKRAQDEITETVLREGWSDTAQAFTQSFGSEDLDASNLMLPIVGLVSADDPRMLATIDAIEARLTDERGLVYRYRTAEGANADGLAGEEGTFLLCTFWLAHALAMSGQVDRARSVFERAVGFVNDVGLLSEEIDGDTGEMLGNFPQAFSHIGLVNAAWSIAEAEARAADARMPRPAELAATRDALHRLAEHVLSPARYAVVGRIGLRANPGGFATPPFGADAVVVGVEGSELVVRAAGAQRRAPITTLGAAAEFVGVPPQPQRTSYEPTTSYDGDAPLSVDPAAARLIADWYATGSEALRRFAESVPEDGPSEAQLWPEHFDLALTAAGVNYGVSPGDEHSSEPYAYVGPHGGRPATDDGFWNAPFGAARTIRDIRGVEDVVAFFRAGRERLHA